uniref:Uncharacterized protein n=1 Tax=Nelumbo nucifera TaxID=4432 RepID=A0A822Z6S9_NELNU|nr:TPA_asm: hypothetical protein HUJ06_013422 [Nelumbo nucifera]
MGDEEEEEEEGREEEREEEGKGKKSEGGAAALRPLCRVEVAATANDREGKDFGSFPSD